MIVSILVIMSCYGYAMCSEDNFEILFKSYIGKGIYNLLQHLGIRRTVTFFARVIQRPQAFYASLALGHHARCRTRRHDRRALQPFPGITCGVFALLVASAVAVAAKDVASPVAAAPKICFPGAAIRQSP